MPTYCFENKKGKFVHQAFSMKRCPSRVRVGKLVYRKNFICGCDTIAKIGDRKGKAKWPMLSEAAAVNPRQVEEMRAEIQRRGLQGVDVVPDGRIQLDTYKARRDFNKSFGYHDNHGFD